MNGSDWNKNDGVCVEKLNTLLSGSGTKVVFPTRKDDADRIELELRRDADKCGMTIERLKEKIEEVQATALDEGLLKTFVEAIVLTYPQYVRPITLTR
jgi:hypothetical protein